MVCAYVNLLPWAMVPFTCGEADVSWRSCSHVQDPFTSRLTVTCIFRSHVQLLFTLDNDSKLRDCEYIYHCSGIECLWKLILVIFMKVDVESSKYKNNICCLGTTKTELFRYVSVNNFRLWPLPSSVLCEVQTEVKSRLSISVPKGQSCSKQTWIPIWQCPY